MASWAALRTFGNELRLAEPYGPLIGDEVVTVFSPQGAPRRAREGSVPLTSLQAPQPHIIRRVIGTSDCPMIERTTPGESVNNAAKLKLALETYGYLDAGPFGAAYDLAFTAPHMLATPVVSIEGNGSQEFHGVEADLNNSPLISIPAGPGGVPPAVIGGSETQYGPTAVMFSFEGEAIDNRTPSVSINWGGEAHLRGIKIVGPPLAPGVGYWNNVITGRYIDRLFVEGCDIYGWSFGAMITATAVRHGGSLSHNWLHDMNCTHVRPPDGDWTTQATAILIDDGKPYDGTLVVQDPGSLSLLNYVAWSDGFLIEENAITDLMDHGTLRQTDGINIQVLSSNHRLSGGLIRNIGEGIDCWGHNTIIHGLRIDDCSMGLKLINGFKDSNVSNCTISNCQRTGIFLQASGRSAIPTENNIISGCKVSYVNMALEIIGAACLELSYSAGFTDKGAVSRLLVASNFFDPVGLAHPIVGNGEGDNQHFSNNLDTVRGDAVPSSFTHFATNSSYAPVGNVISSHYMMANLATDLNNITGNSQFVEVGGWTKLTDLASEFDATTGIYTVNALGNYRISFQLTFKGVTTSITSLVVIVHTTNNSGAGNKDWTFVGDPNTVSGDVTVSGVVDDIFTAPTADIRLMVRAIGDATSPVGLKSIVGGNSRYSNFTVTKV